MDIQAAIIQAICRVGAPIEDEQFGHLDIDAQDHARACGGWHPIEDDYRVMHFLPYYDDYDDGTAVVAGAQCKCGSLRRTVAYRGPVDGFLRGLTR